MAEPRSSELLLTPPLVVIPTQEGVADWERAAILRGSARSLWELGRDSGSLQAAREALEEQGASADQAAQDLEEYVRDLQQRGLSYPPNDEACAFEVSPSQLSEQRPTKPSSNGSLGQAEFAFVLRELARRQLSFRFRARGRSMRPLLPDQSLLQIETVDWTQAKLGQVAAYLVEDHLVAHRVIAREKDHLKTRGDSAARIDRVTPEDFLGIVQRVEVKGRWTHVSTGWRRWVGWLAGRVHGVALAVLQPTLFAWLRRSFRGPSLLRGAIIQPIRWMRAVLRRLERGSVRMGQRLDRWRVAWMTAEEMDDLRTRLYATKSVQSFTSLEENLEAGLTPLEELVLTHHPLDPCRTLVVGCGPGRECFALAERGFEVVGMDREEGMLARARQLAEQRGAAVEFLQGEAQEFDLDRERFDLVVIFSGLYNMVLPRERRVAMLRSAWRHLAPRGHLWVTFLSAYLPPGTLEPPPGRRLMESLNPDHQRGDLFLLNEPIHLFPHPNLARREFEDAGFKVIAMHRDQRAYERFSGQVRGYAVLQRPK